MSHQCHIVHVICRHLLTRCCAAKCACAARCINKTRKAIPTVTAVAAVLMIIGLLHTNAIGDAPLPINVPPTIIDFGVSSGPGGLSFSGQVVDEEPGGLTISFGGLLNSHETTTNEFGHFQYTADVDGPGLVTAQTNDGENQPSNIAIQYIY